MKYVVTGAGGSIGSEICTQLVTGGARELRLVSLTESGLYHIERKLRSLSAETEIVGVLGSVCDRVLMDEVCEGVDVVIHAAAHKHVPICEENPISAIHNNVFGTLIAATAAEESGVGQFLLISTDKAVRPLSIMGRTKRAAEMIVSEKARRSSGTIFAAVRFGNVLDSAGSVLPLWREQIARGGPLTLTDKRCERYFMSIPQACQMVLDVLQMRRPGTFIFDMGKPKLLVKMARQLIRESGKRCEIRVIGLRQGEKLTEELYFGGDPEPTENPRISRLGVPGRDPKMAFLQDMLGAVKCRRTIQAIDDLRQMTSC